MQTQGVDESTRYFMSGYERPNKALAHLDRSWCSAAASAASSASWTRTRTPRR